MKKSLFAVFILAIVMSSCGKLGKKNDTLIINKAFDQYITAFTSGVISSHDAIQVVFEPDFAATINKSNSRHFFFFSFLCRRPSASRSPPSTFTGQSAFKMSLPVVNTPWT